MKLSKLLERLAEIPDEEADELDVCMQLRGGRSFPVDVRGFDITDNKVVLSNFEVQ